MNRSLIRHLALAILPASIFFTTSCTDETDISLQSDHIQFITDIQNIRETPTRGISQEATRSNVSVLQADGINPLYLHTMYIDSIATDITKQTDNNEFITRATPISEENMYDSFSISAFTYISSWDENLGPNYMYDVSVNKVDGLWIPSSTHYWPGSSYKIKFFAYAPKTETSYRLSGLSEKKPTLTCTVPAEVSEQKDLLVAASGEMSGASNKTVQLTFRHAMTAVKFVCGDDIKEGTVKSITMKNIYSRGVYDMDNAVWNEIDTPTDFHQAMDRVIDKSQTQEITTSEQTFMMIPQTLAKDAEIEIILNDGKTEHTLKASIADGVWTMGTTIIYKISTQSINWEYVLEATSPEDFTFQGGKKTYTLASYRQDNEGKKEPVAWEATFSTDGGENWSQTPPEWLQGFAANGEGNTANTTYSVTVSPQQEKEDGLHREALMSAAPKGTVRPYNLSNANGAESVENTANCYVVDAPGWYSFPLVYGNAIKNGQTNSSAYTSKAAGTQSSILSPFINHLEAAIIDPYIHKNPGCNPYQAELLWQDAPALVSDVKYNPGRDGGYISFRVEKNSICQGNAVIAVKDSIGFVLWSWHIWVTDEDIRNVTEITNHTGKKFALMPVNLGWCDVKAVRYDERVCIVKVTANAKTQEIVFKQNAYKYSTAGNNPYYQWGRKDPFCPSSESNNNNKTWYASDGTGHNTSPKKEDLGQDKNAIKNFIRQPDVMQEITSGDGRYINLWSADNTSLSVNDNDAKSVKTIYDPCPPGFMVPPGNTFTGFSKTGEYVPSSSSINGYWDSLRMGWYFYTDNSARETIFFPTPGWRIAQKVQYVRQYGFYWLAIPQADKDGRHLNINKTDFHPYFNASRSFGMSIRPCHE